jgi:protein ImuB
MRRILSVWLPYWPILRLRRDGSPDKPTVTVETARGVRRLAAIGPDAAAQGLSIGQTLADARTLCPGLLAEETDPAADAEALSSLAAWCERYTPLAAADLPDTTSEHGLWLDITGCAHLFDGEEALAKDLQTRLSRNGLLARCAIAGTPGAAWALSHAVTTGPCTRLPAGQERQALALLPIALLRLDPKITAGLRRLGLRQVGDLARIPRGEITARFGPQPLLRLDQALGAAEEAIAWPRPAPPFTERLDFLEPIGTAEDLAHALDLLALRLCARLAGQHQGAHRLAAQFFRVDNNIQLIAIATALPSHDAGYLAKLLRAQLETVEPGFGIETILLHAEETAGLAMPQTGFADIADNQEASRLSTAIDRLANRLGQSRVWRVAPRASHVPERAVQKTAPLQSQPVQSQPVQSQPGWITDPAAPRPIRLLRTPEPVEVTALVPDDPPVLFHWRRRLHRVRAAAGPERIAAEWWRQSPPVDFSETDLIRDYYRVEDMEGARFWLFRTGLHGNGRIPRWYLHGLFP